MTIPAMPSQEDAGGTGMAERTHSGPAGALLGVLQRNRDLLRNAGSLAGTTGLTSVFGVVFWIIAAREFSQQAVGYGSTAISAMTLLGTVGMFGLGTMLIGELPGSRRGAACSPRRWSPPGSGRSYSGWASRWWRRRSAATCPRSPERRPAWRCSSAASR